MSSLLCVATGWEQDPFLRATAVFFGMNGYVIDSLDALEDALSYEAPDSLDELWLVGHGVSGGLHLGAGVAPDITLDARTAFTFMHHVGPKMKQNAKVYIIGCSSGLGAHGMDLGALLHLALVHAVNAPWTPSNNSYDPARHVCVLMPVRDLYAEDWDEDPANPPAPLIASDLRELCYDDWMTARGPWGGPYMPVINRMAEIAERGIQLPRGIAGRPIVPAQLAIGPLAPKPGTARRLLTTAYSPRSPRPAPSGDPPDRA